MPAYLIYLASVSDCLRLFIALLIVSGLFYIIFRIDLFEQGAFFEKKFRNVIIFILVCFLFFILIPSEKTIYSMYKQEPVICVPIP